MVRNFARLAVGVIENLGVLHQFAQQNLNVGTPSASRQLLDHLAQHALSIVRQRWDVTDILGELVRDVWEPVSKWAFATIGIDAKWNIDSPLVLDAIEQRINRSVTMPDAIFEDVKGALVGQFYGRGESAVSPEFLDALKDHAALKNEYHAERIARTEVSTIQAQASFEIWRRNGVTHKKWIHSGSDYPRHKPLSGLVLPLEELFILNAGTDTETQLMYPHDPNGEAGQVINCKCSLGPIVKLADIDRIQATGVTTE